MTALDALPPLARARLVHLQQLASDAGVLAENARAVADRLLDEQHAADRRRDHAPDDAARNKLTDELRRVEAQVALAREAQRKRSAVQAHHAQVLARVRDWCARPHSGVFVEVEPVTPVLKNETVTQALDGLRREIADAQSALAATRRAPLPAADVKARIRERVAALVEQGRPRIDAAGNISWGTSTPHHAPFAPADEVLALLAWADPQTILERLAADIDARDQAGAMSEPARVAKVRELEGLLLRLERIEQDHIELAERQGVSVLRRVDADPRATLGVMTKARARAAVAA